MQPPEFRWTPELARQFFDYHVISKGGSQTTADKYAHTAARFFAWVTEKKLPLTAETVAAWLRDLYLAKGNKANSTRASRLSGLRTVCRWLVDRGLLAEDPTEGVPTPKFSSPSAQKFSIAELADLFDAPAEDETIGIRDRAILMLFYATGMRRQEMSSLTLTSLYLGAMSGRVHVVGKGAKHRVVGFAGPVVDALKKWLIIRPQNGQEAAPHVFIALHGKNTGRGLGLTGLGRVMKRAARVAGMPNEYAFLHKLRSTFATHLYDSGVAVNEIALLMGHSSELTTWRYISISEKHLRKARIPQSRWDEIEKHASQAQKAVGGGSK